MAVDGEITNVRPLRAAGRAPMFKEVLKKVFGQHREVGGVTVDKPISASHRFAALGLFAALLVANRKANLELTEADLWMVSVAVTGFILGKSAEDLVKRFAAIKGAPPKLEAPPAGYDPVSGRSSER